MENNKACLTEVSRHHRFKFEEYLVFYFDILAQKRVLKDLKVDCHGENAEINKIFSCIVEFNTRMRGFLKDAKDLSSQFIMNNSIFKTEDDKKKALRSLSKMDIGLQQFSDLTMIYVKTGTLAAWAVAFIILIEISILMTFQMANGFVVRGSVVKGLGCKLGNKCLYGPVILNAYEIEAQISQWGRIVFSKEAYEFLKGISVFARQVGINENSDIVYGFNNLIKKDIDGAMYLDYLAPEMIRFFKKRNYGCENVIAAHEAGLKYIKKQLNESGAPDEVPCEDRKLALRYKIMEYYWISRMKEWCDEERVRKILGE